MAAMSHSLESRPETLQRGQPVFLLGYHDREMRLPFVEPFVFLGVEQAADGSAAAWYFQRAESFLRSPITDLEAAEGDEVLAVGRDGLCTFVDWAGLVAELAEGLESQRPDYRKE
jgi:hypothetical protein